MTSSTQTQARYLEKRQLVERFLKEQGHTFNVFPLSYAQQRLWFLDQLYPGSPLYNIPAAVQLSGPLHVNALQHSLNAIVRRHEVLRTTFTIIEGQPVQAVRPQLTLALPVIDLGLLPTSERADEVQRRITQEAQTPFELTRGPLLRATLLRLGEAEHVLLFTMHHIIADGWSLGVLVRELAILYETFAAGKSGDSALPGLPELPIQYADFAAWQHEWLAGGALEEQLKYWQRQLGGPLPVLALPTDRPRPAVQSFHGAKHILTLPVALTEALKALSQQEQSTLFMTLLAAFKVLLHRYTGQPDIIVGSPIANRRLAETEELIGFFANTLVLRSDLSENPTFRALLARVRASCLGAYTHQDVPFEKLVEVLQPVRDPGHSPLFQVLFALQNTPMPAFELTHLTLHLLEIDSRVAKFDLTLNLEERADGLHGWFEYNTDLFERETMARMTGHFQTLLAGLVAAPDTPIAHLPLLAAAERHQLLVEWNATTVPFPRQCCIHDLVAAQAARTPAAPALVAPDGCLTYRELDQRANQLAHHLRALGVGPDVCVGVGLPRSAAFVVGVLGILKAGGAYVPLDLSYPAERLAFMLADAQAPVLLTAPQGLSPAAVGTAQVVDLAADWPAIAQQPSTPPPSGVTPDNLAYVIYTSGSTGQPKGVAVPHRAVNRLVCNTNYIHLDSTDSLAQVSNCAFDAATFEIWGALVHGARLIILATDIVLAPHDFAAHLTQHGITVLFLTTALFHQLARAIPSAFRQVRTLLFGGEAADPQWVANVLKHGPPQRLLNVYGPTETTTFASWYLVQEVPEGVTSLPIGRPITNTQMYVLDRHLQPVPLGVAGELYIGGDGLARGYLNRPELTAERFIAAPEALSTAERLYRTGDVVRYLPDGNLEFLGRLDDQVKLRGFRIELGEVEALLRQHPNVLESAVLVHEEAPGDKRLVAYVVWSPLAVGQESSSASGDDLSNNGPWTSALRDFLRERVPEYMVPSAFVFLDALPLTPNGKADRRALPQPGQMHNELEATFVAPRQPTEQALAEIWARVLKRERVGIHHNFFDLGGHSLLATEVMAAVHDTFQADVPLRHLFENPTIARLAEVIEEAQRSGAEPQRPTIIPVTREAHRIKLSTLTSRTKTIQIEEKL